MAELCAKCAKHGERCHAKRKHVYVDEWGELRCSAYVCDLDVAYERKVRR